MPGGRKKAEIKRFLKALRSRGAETIEKAVVVTGGDGRLGHENVRTLEPQWL